MPVTSPWGPICAAAIAALAGWITLVLARTTSVSEFRQKWTDSFRTALADFTASAELIRGRIRIRAGHKSRTSGKTEFDPSTKEKLEKELTEYWSEFRKSHALVLLHLKEVTFKLQIRSGLNSSGRIGKEVRDEGLRLLDDYSKTKSALAKAQFDNLSQSDSIPVELALEWELHKVRLLLECDYALISTDTEIPKHIEKLRSIGRGLIKDEWERIKDGEVIYRRALKIFPLVLAIGVGLLWWKFW